MPFTVPVDTHVFNDTGHTTDHNHIVDAINQSGAAYNVLNTTFSGGADPSGASDSTAAISAAITAAAANSPSGRVYFPAGTYLTSAQSIPMGVSLVGDGPFATTIKLKSGAATLDNMFINQQNYSGINDAQACSIRDMRLDGNLSGQGATWNCGIVFNNDTPSGSFSYTDGRHFVSNVIIQNFTGDGFVQAGRGGVTCVNVQVWDCSGFGFNLFEDSHYTNCNVGGCGIDGFLIHGGSNRLTSCKAYFSGAALVSGRGVGATLLSVTPPANAWDGGNIAGLTFSLANGFGNGFHWESVNGSSRAGNFSAGSYSALGAQDNARAGFYVVGGRHSLVGIDADSNNNNGTSSGIIPNASYAGIDLACSDCIVSGVSWDRSANTNHSAAALNVGSGNIKNAVRLQFHGTLNDGSNLPPLLAGAVQTSNSLQFGGMGSGSLKAEAFNASYTPDPFLSEVKTMTLTGAITVNNPALTGTNTTGIFLINGMKLTLIFTQNNTGGWVVTMGGAFKMNGLSFTTTANATTAITFIYDGTNWQAVS